MLSIAPNQIESFSNLGRRELLRIGGLTALGLNLPEALRAQQAATGGTESPRGPVNCILLWMLGGPSHIDMYDLKPNAPKEVRGEFNPIATSAPGIEICEMFPRMAKMMDKFIPIRSISDADGRHDCYQCMTGRRFGSRKPPGGWPARSPALPVGVGRLYRWHRQ